MFIVSRRADNTTFTFSGPQPAQSLNYSALKKVSRKREVPVLNEDDLEETFIKGALGFQMRALPS